MKSTCMGKRSHKTIAGRSRMSVPYLAALTLAA